MTLHVLTQPVPQSISWIHLVGTSSTTSLTILTWHLQIFTSLELFMGGKGFSPDDEILCAIKQWAKQAKGDLFEESITNLTTVIKKEGDYVEKQGFMYVRKFANE